MADPLANFGVRRWNPLLVGVLVVLLIGGAGYGIYWAFFGTGGDLRLLQVRIWMDGSAGGHTFHTGSQLEGHSFAELNLRGARFPQVKARQADFHKAKLRGARFTGCELDRVNFRYADLRHARIRQSNLEGADLRGANLSWADLGESSLRFALVASAATRQTNLEGADLTGVVGLTVTMVKRCKNWHLALYDKETALAISTGSSVKEIKALGFASWDDWLNEQYRLAVSAPQPPDGDDLGGPQK